MKDKRAAKRGLFVEVFNVRKIFVRAALAAAAVFLLAAAALAAPLAKNRATAVILYDVDAGQHYSSVTVWNYYGGASFESSGKYAQGAALATETIRGELLRCGYKVVSDRITANIIKAQSRPAGAGSVRQLSRTFGVSQYIDGSVQVLDAERNDLGMYSGAAVVMVHGYDRTGRAIFSDSVTARAVGATADEAEINAVRQAALEVSEKLTGYSSNPDAADGGMYVNVSGASSFGTVKSVQNACKSVVGVTSVRVRRYEGDTAHIGVYGDFNVSELQRAIVDKVPYARIIETNEHTIYVSIY